MISFLEKLVRQIIDDHKDISNLWIVLPTHRSTVYFKHYLKSQIVKSSWLPNILTIDDFIKKHAGIKQVNQIQLILKLFKIHLEIEKEKAESIDQFINWGNMLLADFNEIDHYLLNYSTVFQDLKNIKEIDNWSFNEDELTDIQKKNANFWSKIPTYYKILNEELDKKGLGYNGKIYKWAANSIFEIIDEFEDNSVYFAGFNALSNSEKQIIETFVSTGKGNFIIDGDCFYVDNDKHEAGYFIRKNNKSDNLKSHRWIENHFKSSSKDINIISASSNVIQAKYCGQILETFTPEQINKTAVILADESLLVPLLNSLPKKIDKYNISMGYNLFYSPLGNLIQSIFNLQQNLNSYNSSIHYKTLFSLVDNYLLNIKNQTLQLRTRIIRSNSIFLSLKNLQNDPSLTEIKFILKKWDSNNLFSSVKETFYHLIKLLKSKLHPDSHSLELEYLFEFQKLLIKLDNEIGESNFFKQQKTIKNLVFKLLKSENVSFVGEPLDGLQIIGTLETRSLDFEHIIMLSVNDDLLPKSSSTNSFIPYELKRLYGLPTFTEREAIYAHHFYRLLQRAKNIHLIYNESIEGVGGSEKSRYINQITHELPIINSNISVVKRVLEISPEPNNVESITVKNDRLIIDKLFLINEKGFSPTALRTFINCPLDFYFKYIVGLRDEEEVSETIEANTLGNIIHKVLERLYKPYLGKKLAPENVTTMLSEYKQILTAEFIEQYSKNYLLGKNYLLYYASDKTIYQFLIQEKEICANHNLVIIELEKQFEKDLTFLINKEKKTIKYRGTIDRIDQLDGKIRLIDYKTGKVDPSSISLNQLEEVFTNPKKEKAFQLLLYYFLVKDHYPSNDVIPGIISFKSIKSGMLTLKTGKTYIEELIESYPEQLIFLTQQLFDLENLFIHNEKSNYCMYC